MLLKLIHQFSDVADVTNNIYTGQPYTEIK